MFVPRSLLSPHDKVFELPADRRALRQPEDEPAAHLLTYHEQVQVLADLAVVALSGLLQPPQVLVELSLRWPRRRVQPLQLRPVLISAPVRCGQAQELNRSDPARVLNMRPSAEVREGSHRVDGDSFVLRQQVDRLYLVRLVREHLQRPLPRDLLADERLPGLDKPPHALLDLREVLGCERAWELEVVVEAVLYRRTVRELRVWEHLQHRRGHDMRRRVPHRVQWREHLHVAAVVHLVLDAGAYLRAHGTPPKSKKPLARLRDERLSSVVPPEFTEDVGLLPRYGP